MVRRLLLTALAVVLAVALPASAEGPASDPGPSPLACAPLDAACLEGQAVAACPAWTLLCSAESASSVQESEETGFTGCGALSFDLSQGLHALVLDPDGCIREFIRRTLGWPPLESAAPAIETMAVPLLPF